MHWYGAVPDSFCIPATRILHPVAFRVEGKAPSQHRTYKFGGLLPRNPKVSPTLRHAHHHMTWHHEETLYVSVWNNWRRAVTWARYLVDKKGYTNVVIIAIDLEAARWTRIINALALSKALGYLPKHQQYHEGEWLLEGGVDQTQYSVLAMIPCGRTLVDVPVHLGMVSLPKEVWEDLLRGSRMESHDSFEKRAVAGEEYDQRVMASNDLFQVFLYHEIMCHSGGQNRLALLELGQAMVTG